MWRLPPLCVCVCVVRERHILYAATACLKIGSFCKEPSMNVLWQPSTTWVWWVCVIPILAKRRRWRAVVQCKEP